MKSSMYCTVLVLLVAVTALHTSLGNECTTAELVRLLTSYCQAVRPLVARSPCSPRRIARGLPPCIADTRIDDSLKFRDILLSDDDPELDGLRSITNVVRHEEGSFNHNREQQTKLGRRRPHKRHSNSGFVSRRARRDVLNMIQSMVAQCCRSLGRCSAPIQRLDCSAFWTR